MASSVPAPAFHLDGDEARYAVYVEPPPRRLREKHDRWLAVLCLDGDDRFSDLCRARKRLASTHALPPLLLVGLGYGAGDPQPGNHRVRDYTPCPLPEEPRGGGAERFHAFLTEVVWPELARRHPLESARRGLVGHSLGGLFALHALFRSEPFFNHVAAGSPSLWWRGRVLLETVARIQNSNTPVPARLALGVGLRDGNSMVADVDRLAAQLAARPVPGLTVHTARFPGRTHFTAIPVTFRTALAALFGGPRMDCPA